MAGVLILHQVRLLHVPHSNKALSNKQILLDRLKSGAYLMAQCFILW